MSRRNFHTHSYLCKHASGKVWDYCREAVEQGVDTLGFSDHTPFPDGRWNTVRMALGELPSYLNDLKIAQVQYPQVKIIPGMECEYVPEYKSFFTDVLLGESKLVYLAGAAHSYLHHGEWKGIYGKDMGTDQLHSYANYLIEAMESGLFSFIAHPDLFGVCYRGWDAETDACSREIAKAAASCGIPLEINAYGFRKPLVAEGGDWRHMYPWLPFWSIMAEYSVKVIVNSDAHKPEDVWGNTDQCLDLTRMYGLETVNDTFLGEK